LAPEIALKIENLTVCYDRFVAARNVSISVAKGNIVSIIGANGAGKSSLLKAVMRQATVTSGTVALNGTDLSGLTTAQVVGAGLALVPEGRRVFSDLTVAENLKIGLSLRSKPGMTLNEIYDAFPALFAKRDHYARHLSGGQQQMVAIGRALLMAPDVLLCDEISLGLAPVVIGQLYEYLVKLRDRGLTIVVVEQDITRSLAVADYFYCMLKGQVSLEGRPPDYDREAIIASYFGAHKP